MKKMIRKFVFCSSGLLPVLLLGLQAPLAMAAETNAAEAEKAKTDVKKSSCKQCLKYTGWRGDLDFGLGFLTDDSLRFGDYRGTEEHGFYAAVDGDLHFRNPEGRYFDLRARDLGLDSRELDMRGGNQGRYELRFGWNEIPKYRGYGTQTPFIGMGSDFLTLPANWVPATTTDGMTALDSSLVAASLKTQRKTFDAGATLKFARNWSYRLDFQRQEKKGTRAFGAGLLFNNSTILPAPVDFTTNLIDMGLTWAGKRGQVQLGFMGSYFENGDTSMTWQNPFTASPQHQAFRAALEPDNEYYQFNLSGAFAVTPRIRLSGKAAIGRMSQDEAYLPVTINPEYSDLPLPRSSLDGEVDTSTFNLAGKLSARLNSRLSFTARAKVDERDNKTPINNYIQVTTDLVPGGMRYNRPYSYKREQYSADLRYRALRQLRISGGARQENLDRTLQAVLRTKETTWWGEARVTPLAAAQFRLKFETSDRDGSDYDQPNDGGSIDHPLMRKFNLADRDRNRMKVDFDFTPMAAMGLNISYIYANAEYTESEIGLQESEEQSFSINLNYMASKNTTLYVFFTQDNIDADLINTTGGSAVPWNALTEDRIKTGGLGISSKISEKSSIGFDIVSSDSKGNIWVQTTLDEAPFAPLRTDLRNARFHFDRVVNDNWGYKLYAEYEKFDSKDWAIDGVGVDGISSVLTMGLNSPHYSAWYFRVQANYRF